MADVKISALPASTTPLAGTEILPIVQSATTRQVSVANLTAGRSVGGTDFIPSGSSAPTNGMFLPSANTLGFSTNSTQRMAITSGGAMYLGATLGNNFSFTYGSAVDISGSGTGLAGTGTNLNLGVWNGPMVFQAGNNGTALQERMRITSAGELLVGTTSAVNSSKFLVAGVSSANSPVIQGSASAGAYLNFFNNAQTTGSVQIGQGFGSGSDNVGYLSNNSNAAFVFATNGTERLRLDASGNLGLGVTPPATTAGKHLFIGTVGDILDDGASYYVGVHNAVFNSGWKYRVNGYAQYYVQDDVGKHIWYNAASGTAGNAISFTQAMTLDANGNFMVGTTTANNNNTMSFAFNVANGNQYCNHINGTASGTGYIQFIYDGTGIGSITQSGTTAVLYNLTSDARLKTNIVDAPLGNIDDVKVRSFDWKSDGSHVEYGFIAQELVEVAPYAVHQPKDSEEMMAVDYSKLVPMMIKEIQDLKARLLTLENK